MYDKFRKAPVPSPRALAVLALGVMSFGANVPVAQAFQFNTTDPDLRVRWDNTVKYTAGWRVKDRDAGLVRNVNANDGNLNFDRGLINNRLDLLSEFDVVYRNFGLRLSGAAWYDNVYMEHNDHPNDGTANPVSVDHDEFTDRVRRIHGRKAELLDAFVFGRFELADKPTTVRLGRHAQVWGESLFFGANAIAGGMAPVDVVKLSSVPSTQFKEAIRPVNQVSGQIQLSSSVSLSGYYQFRWEANRLPAAGSYFSGVDTAPTGGERLLLGLPVPPFAASDALELDDEDAKDSGQGGLQLRVRAGETDLGFYVVRFHNKAPQQVVNLGLMGPVVTPISYRLNYHERITAYGASVSRTFGDVNIAGEASIRRDQDLASSQAFDTSALGGPATNNRGNPAYAVGRTAHVNLSALWSLPPGKLFPEANFIGEIAWNRVLKVTKNKSALDPNATRDAVALRMTFEPMYRQVVPGWDVSVPVGLGYAPKGSRSMALGPGVMPANGGGDISIGVNGIYLDQWRLGLNYTHYYGAADQFLTDANTFSYKQYLKDRDFVTFSVNRTF